MKSHEINTELQNNIIKTIHINLSQSIDKFVHDHKRNTQAIINLVMTLKYWANPDGKYVNLFDKNTISTYFEHLQSIINNPKILLDNIDLTHNEEVYLQKVLSIKLNTIAEDLIQKYHLQASIQAKLEDMNTRTNAFVWWNNKTLEEQNIIQQQYAQLPEEQRQSIERTNPPLPVYSGSNGIFITQIDPFPFFYMCNHCAHLNYLLLDATIRGALMTGRAIAEGTSAIANLGTHTSSGNGGICSGGSGAAKGFPIVGLILLVTSGFIGGAYAIKNAYYSCKNILHGNNPLKHFSRLAGIGVGGYYGALGGGAVGALIGSCVPVLGTVAGFVIGAVFGSGLCAGLSAALVNYAEKLILICKYGDATPNKYKLKPDQINHLRDRGFNLTTITNMIKAIRNERGNMGILDKILSLWPWSRATKQKDRWNVLLKNIKNGIIAGPIQIDGCVYHPKLHVRNDPSQEIVSSTAKYIDIGIQSQHAIPSPTIVTSARSDQPDYFVPQPIIDRRFSIS